MTAILRDYTHRLLQFGVGVFFKKNFVYAENESKPYNTDHGFQRSRSFVQ